MKTLTCFRCQKVVQATIKRYKRLLEKTNNDEEKLRTSYLCKDCRPKKEKK